MDISCNAIALETILTSMEGMQRLIEEKGIQKTLPVLESAETVSTLYEYHSNSYLPAPLWKFSGEYGAHTRW